MKYSIAGLVVAIFLCMTSHSQVVLQVTKLESNKGHVLVSLFRDSNGYPDKAEKAIRKVELVIENGIAVIEWKDIEPGTYAIAVLHDENDNRKMDKNWLGIPKEGYGFSNNVMGTLGPPSFEKASFTYNAGTRTTINIRMRY